MTTEEPSPKSEYKYGDRYLHELTHRELLNAVDTIWRVKSDEVTQAKAERDGYKTLLNSPLPIHSLWRGVAENAMLLGTVLVIAYLAGRP